MNNIKTPAIFLGLGVGFFSLVNYFASFIPDETKDFQINQDSYSRISTRDPELLTSADISFIASLGRIKLEGNTVGQVYEWDENRVLMIADSSYVAEHQNDAFLKGCIVTRIYDLDKGLTRIIEIEGGRQNCFGTAGNLERF